MALTMAGAGVARATRANAARLSWKTKWTEAETQRVECIDANTNNIHTEQEPNGHIRDSKFFFDKLTVIKKKSFLSSGSH